MERKSLVAFLTLNLVFTLLALNAYTLTKAATTHLVISEVQISGFNAEDEFVELFNPTESDVDLTGWRLTRSTSTGTEANLVASLSGSLAPGRHLLIAHANYLGSVTQDITYSTDSNIAANGATTLYSDAGLTAVDRVGFGTGVDFETQTVSNPVASGSAERSPKTEDTDNNSVDFALREVSDPQNSASVTASPSVSPSPSVEPSPLPSVTASPTSTPTATPTSTPSASPVVSATPTVSPSPIVSPTPTATVRPGKILAHFGNMECRMVVRVRRFGFMMVPFPTVVCTHLGN